MATAVRAGAGHASQIQEQRESALAALRGVSQHIADAYAQQAEADARAAAEPDNAHRRELGLPVGAACTRMEFFSMPAERAPLSAFLDVARLRPALLVAPEQYTPAALPSLPAVVSHPPSAATSLQRASPETDRLAPTTKPNTAVPRVGPLCVAAASHSAPDGRGASKAARSEEKRVAARFHASSCSAAARAARV